jgi:hypothetical protein
MHVVAIVELATPVEVEASALAADLESTLYEQRLNLVAGLPAVVLATPELGRAEALLRKIRKRGHGAVTFDTAAVVPSGAMVPLRHCHLEPGGLAAESPAGLGVPNAPAEVVERLPFDDILALIRATHRRRVETKTEVKQRQFGLGRAVASGGLLLTKTVTREETRVSDERDQVLYLFRKSGELPWLLYERSAGYGWLGDKLSPSSLQNFVVSVALLRARAPGATYDERLIGYRKTLVFAAHGGTATDGRATSTEPTTDLLAHLLALRFSQASAGAEAAAP